MAELFAILNALPGLCVRNIFPLVCLLLRLYDLNSSYRAGLKSHKSGVNTPILMDSGALGASYVSKAWLNENREEVVRDSHVVYDKYLHTIGQSI